MRILISAVLMLLPLSAFAADDTAVKEQADEMFSKCDTNNDGQISRSEFDQEKENKFNEFDKNRDGQLSKEEHEEMAVEMHKKLMG